MTRFARWIAFLLALSGSTAAFAQGTAAIQRHCYLGGTQAKTSGLSSTNYLNGIIPSCTVTVYLTGTQTKATIYKDSGGTPLANPFTGNAANAVDPGGWIFWAAVNTGYDVVMSGGIAPNTYATPVTLNDVYPSFQFSGGATLPAVTEVISGDGSGNGVGMPEKPTNLIAGTPNTATVQCDEDWAEGRFDPRCATYAGGVYGATPGAAWQAFSDRLVCYESMVGKHPHVQFPPGTFAVGTVAQPTLKLPTGAIYTGGGGWGFATNATEFQATYNNHRAIEFDAGLTSTTNCSDGVPHTANMGGGSYDGFSEHGCGQGGCVNVPGDSGNYPFGGPSQTGIGIFDANASIAMSSGVFASNNGADGVLCNGQDSHCGEVGGSDNNEYFYFGMDVAGQNYQFSAGECHADVVLGGLDNMNPGPFEMYGTTMTLGWEYGHIAGICWAGGLTNLGHYFSQIEEIGVIHVAGGDTEASADSGRIDAPRGDGILELGNGRTGWHNPRVIAACRADGAGTNSYLVYSVTTATPGSGQTPGTYLLTGSDGHTQISVTVASDGTVSTNPLVTVHGRGMTNTPPTYTLSAGGTPATFTATMQPVFELLHEAGGSPAFAACDYIDDQSSGKDTWIDPMVVDNSFFGASHATGDVITPVNQNAWISAQGNSSSGDVIWDPNPAASGNFFPGGAQRIARTDFASQGGGTAEVGSVIDLNTIGTHVKMANTGATTLTTINGATIMEDIWITGDGFTTMPFANQGDVGTIFGATTCSTHSTLLNAGQIYHYVVTNGLNGGTQPKLTEVCDTIFTDYLQPGFNWLAQNTGLPATTTQATMDVAGSYAVRPYPALVAPTVTTAGGSSSFSYCWGIEFWVAGGKQTSPLTCETHTPPVSTGPNDNVIFRLTAPQNWTRYQIRLNSTTDPSFTPGVWYDVTAPNGLPQPATCTLAGNCPLTGMPLVNKVPTDTSVIATANLGLNMTGTYNVSLGGVAVPASSSTLCVQGQVLRDVSGGFDYVCDTEDHWKRSAVTWSNF